MAGPIEHYRLYGEPIRHVEPRFIHVEPIRERSGFHHWRIAPHTHRELHQLLLVSRGGGAMNCEASSSVITVPAILVIPAGTVHGFAFEPGSDGWVISIARTAMPGAATGDGLIATLFDRARCVGPIDREAARQIGQSFLSLSSELAWDGAGRNLAIEGDVLKLFVAFARAGLAHERMTASLTDAESVLLSRFRALVEAHFAEHLGVAVYARRLGVSEDRLLAVCRKRFGAPPIQIIHQRLMVEAQRWLLYTSAPVGLIADALGFKDISYFSRFFAQRLGQSPRVFRSAQTSGSGEL
ncbi:Helix-turn-helix domain-containing protein [Hyphomicrobiales bacterium]|nr:Helix-turn-helix domain-containing protein [Hyphomicrobiales bacterium]CAH1699236.1 Helix-turn-helix domain-containing protein [Hyphomicrobiales bacterium]CAI0343023.1 AraC family transcriptional regulator, transcriptional activator of pobA [Hyphomicrobiales bacterium]